MEERRGFGPRRGGFRPREQGRFAPKPVEVGKEYEVDIQEVSRRGEGVARIQELVIFVSNARQGEHAKVKVTRVGRRFAEAEVVGKEEAESEEKKNRNKEKLS
jgi:predicted RNA-binding protein with TRAM domain